MSGAMVQTLAIFHDAYRELNAKRMFWVVLVLSALVVAAFAAVGINQRGLTVLWFEWDMWFNTNVVSKAMFYHWVFSTFGISIWLTWIAMGLALVSTAGMVPDLITGGAVDLYVSKPVSRLRLFLTKYAAGLLFVALQVTIFTTASYFVIGVRGASWEPKLFLAIPLTVLCFSYLFCVCVLIGLLTRSTVAALLLTVLFWLLNFGLNVAEWEFMKSRIAGDMETRAYGRLLGQYSAQIERAERNAATDPSAAPLLARVRAQRDELVAKRERTQPKRDTMRTAQGTLFTIRSFLPKTDEVTVILERSLNVKEEELFTRPEERERASAIGGWFGGGGEKTEVRWDSREVRRAAHVERAARPTWWIIGTSLGFEAVVLGLAAWVFCRRDF